MHPILVDSLHVFVIVMMSAFVIFSVLAAMGKFDHWTAGRFISKRIRFRRKRNFYKDEEM